MDILEAQAIIKRAISGEPNSCNSEHARKLNEVLIWLGETPIAEKPPQLKLYHITLTLEDEFLAESSEEAWEMALDTISNRKGMQLCGHEIQVVT
jgi:hypothetical protein